MEQNEKISALAARPIGVFDSGMGGLTTVSELRRSLPNESIIYFGDTGRVPYGTRSPETIRKYVRQDIQFLLSRKVKLIIAACNTASAVLQETLSELSLIDVPIVEVISPAAKAAKNATKNGKIGVIGTSATINSGAYRRFLSADDGIELFEQACPIFVPLVENGFIEPDNEVTRLVAEGYLSGLRATGLDTLILGCTHYPILRETISRVIGESVTLIDSGREAVAVAREKLFGAGLLCENKTDGRVDCYVSDSVSHFKENVTAIMKDSSFVLNKVEQIDVENS